MGHGETYKHPDDILWWSKGGVLHGESPARIAFLKKTMAGTPFADMQPARLSSNAGLLALPGRLYYIYFRKPGSVSVTLEGDQPYWVEGIDTWKMTTETLDDVPSGERTFTAKTRGYLLRLTAGSAGE